MLSQQNTQEVVVDLPSADVPTQALPKARILSWVILLVLGVFSATKVAFAITCILHILHISTYPDPASKLASLYPLLHTLLQFQIHATCLEFSIRLFIVTFFLSRISGTWQLLSAVWTLYHIPFGLGLMWLIEKAHVYWEDPVCGTGKLLWCAGFQGAIALLLCCSDFVQAALQQGNPGRVLIVSDIQARLIRRWSWIHTSILALLMLAWSVFDLICHSFFNPTPECSSCGSFIATILPYQRYLLIAEIPWRIIPALWIGADKKNNKYHCFFLGMAVLNLGGNILFQTFMTKSGGVEETEIKGRALLGFLLKVLAPFVALFPVIDKAAKGQQVRSGEATYLISSGEPIREPDTELAERGETRTTSV